MAQTALHAKRVFGASAWCLCLALLGVLSVAAPAFAETKTSITGATVKVTDRTYTGSALTPTPSVTLATNNDTKLYIYGSADAPVYTGYTVIVFAKTERTLNDPSIKVLGVSGNKEGVTYAHTSYADVAKSNPVNSWYKVKGGYVFLTSFSTAGAKTIQLLDNNSLLSSLNINVVDSASAQNEWIEGVISSVTTSSMSSLEKMDAVTNYLGSRDLFRYLANVDGHTVSLAQYNVPFWVSLRWDSYTSPSILCEFANNIGGFDDVHNCYYDYSVGTSGWQSTHSYCKVTFNGQTKMYSVCPSMSSGTISSYTAIDFSDLNQVLYHNSDAIRNAPAASYNESTGPATVDEPLTEGVDYTVSYANNTNAGTATVTVTGKGNYTGTVKSIFKITAASLSEASIKAETQTYTGSALTPAPTVKLGDKTLTKDVDYTVSYNKNTKAGTGVVHVTGCGNYTGKKSAVFTIEPASIADATVTAKDQTYTGSALTPVPIVKLGSKSLSKGTDYAVTYSDNVNVGTATVTITGERNYTGTATGTFTIAKKAQTSTDISSANVYAHDQIYTGKALETKVAVVLNGTELKSESEYQVTYSNNVDPGIATVTVTGVGNYRGTATGTFRIRVSFADVSSTTAHADDIYWLADEGISTGWSETNGTRTFRPFTDVMRADMAAFLYRLAGSPAYSAPLKSPFADVSTSTAHYKEICWLASKGISVGWTEANGTKTFRPYASVARADMAAFLYRLAGSPKYSVSGKPFADCNSGTAHYKEVCWLASAGVSEGWTTNGGKKEFRPYATVVRADMAAFLHRMKTKGLV